VTLDEVVQRKRSRTCCKNIHRADMLRATLAVASRAPDAQVLALLRCVPMYSQIDVSEARGPEWAEFLVRMSKPTPGEFGGENHDAWMALPLAMRTIFWRVEAALEFRVVEKANLKKTFELTGDNIGALEVRYYDCVLWLTRN
jgi:hypothetical protein